MIRYSSNLLDDNFDIKYRSNNVYIIQLLLKQFDDMLNR